MATSYDSPPSPVPGQHYTFNEAIEIMKLRDKYVTLAPPIRWVSVRTGKPVSIGYTN